MNQFLTTYLFAYPVFVASNMFSLSLSTCSPGHSSSLVSVSQAPTTARNAFAATPRSSCGAENWRELRLLRPEAETATGSAWCWRKGDATGISALIFRWFRCFFLDVKFYESGDSKFEYAVYIIIYMYIYIDMKQNAWMIFGSLGLVIGFMISTLITWIRCWLLPKPIPGWWWLWHR